MEKHGHTGWELRGTTGILSLGPPPENQLARPEFIPLEVLGRWTSMPGLKGIIVHGQGKHFSAGADTTALFEQIRANEDLEAMMNAGKAVLDHLVALDIPVIAAIQGICFGGGLEIALACHIRICAENALFAFPEVNHGFLPGLGGTVRIRETLGNAEALEMLLGGDMINAQEALRLKLADRVVPRADLMNTAVSLMDKMTRDRPAEVIHAIVRALRNAELLPREEAMAEETLLFAALARKEAERRAAEEA